MNLNSCRMFTTSSSSNRTGNKQRNKVKLEKGGISDNKGLIQHFWAPKIRDIRHWDKYEWIFSVSSLVQFVGFLSYDFILLRALSLISATGLMVAHRGRRFFVGWFWAFSVAIANVVALYIMLREKYSHNLSGLSKEESFIYHTFFEAFNITPLEYKTVIKMGHFKTMPRGETLTVHGLIGDKVFVILSGQCLVLNDNNEVVGVISGGNQKSFVGEIALIDETQDEATATVKTNSEFCRILYWNVDDMKLTICIYSHKRYIIYIHTNIYI